jgi:hypothetical protein
LLADHRLRQENWAMRKRARTQAAQAFGDFLACLATWDWFCTFTFRDQGQARRPLARDMAMEQLRGYVALLGKVASDRFGWALAEEFGRVGGRWHSHALVVGVREVDRAFWWREAYRRFGRTRIEPGRSDLPACHYAAKYEARQLGEIHFGGTLAGVNLSESFAGGSPCPASLFSGRTEGAGAVADRGTVMLPSAPVPKEFFRFSLKHRHR